MASRGAGTHGRGRAGGVTRRAALCSMVALVAMLPDLTGTATAAAAAAGAGVGGGDGVGAFLVLTVESRAGTARVVLACGPDGGTHPQPGAACATLARVGGRPQDLTGDPHLACMTLYDPVLARAEGNWFGNPVSFAASYPNRCVLVRDTAGVFDF